MSFSKRKNKKNIFFVGKKMNLTDQPGRVLAVFVFAPLLFFRGYVHKDWFIILFAIALFLWDALWLTKPPRKIDL